MDFNEKLRDNITKNFELSNCDHQHLRLEKEIKYDNTDHIWHPLLTRKLLIPRAHLRFSSPNKNDIRGFIINLSVMISSLRKFENSHLFGKKYSELTNKIL